MAVVVGKTSERIDQLLAGLVTNLEISPTGRLLVTFRNGAVSDLGAVGNRAVDSSYAGAPGMTATTVEGALDELAASRSLVGEIKMWAGSTEPAGYLFCRGGTFSSVTYPALAAILGDTYGTHSGTTYFLPNFNARSPIGVGGTNGKAGNVNNYSLGQKWGDERPQAHDHGVSDPGHYHAFDELQFDFWAYPHSGPPVAGHTGARVWRNTGGAFTGISIQNSGSGDMQNVHPVLGINFIIKAV
jgi:microcystin-dependent protein